MKVLVAGNSQSGVLKTAITAGHFIPVDGFEISFCVVPGGQGPNLRVDDDRLIVTSFDPNHPPKISPESALDAPLSTYDAVIISALGYVDGGFTYANAIPRQGLLAEFGPKPNDEVSNLISPAVFEQIMHEGLYRHAGVRFLKNLSQAYHGKVIVQPFPYISDYVLEREDWALRRFYEDYRGANQHIAELRDKVLGHICEDCHATLLAAPETESSAQCFTPSKLMNNNDALHAKAPYGAMVWEQVATCLQ